MKTEVFRMERVTYKEGEITKLEDFNLHIFEGEILGLIPVNLHGLSSFLKLLKSNASLYDGYIYYNEVIVNSWKNFEQTNNRITIIQHTSSLVGGLTVADNIFILRHGYKGEYIKTEILEQQLKPYLEEIGLEIKADTNVERLSVFERIVVELLKGVIAGHKLIVLNEIETLITGQELEKLYKIIRYYAKKGFTFIYICLHAEYIVQLCNRAVLLRNGRIEKALQTHELSIEKLQTITRDYDTLVRERLQDKQEDVIQDVESYEMCYEFQTCNAMLHMNIKKAECVVVHCRDTQAYYDMKAAVLRQGLGENGFLRFEGRDLDLASNLDVAIIQERPSKTMLFPRMNYMDNLCFNLDSRMHGVWLKKNIRASIRKEYGKILGDEVFDMPIEELTERQKYSLIYSRILLQKPKIVFCIQPFQGADIDHRMHIWTLLEGLLKKGICVIILAVNLSDTLSIADRLVQIDENNNQQEYSCEEFSNISTLAPWKHLY